jgi:hypothetical protein
MNRGKSDPTEHLFNGRFHFDINSRWISSRSSGRARIGFAGVPTAVEVGAADAVSELLSLGCTIIFFLVLGETIWDDDTSVSI